MKCVHWLGQNDTSESAHAANAWQLLTMERLDSSDSCLLIRICWKVYSETRTKVSIHTEYLCSGGARILIFIVMGARAVISFCVLLPMPGYRVVVPDSTILAYSSLQMSTLHFIMELKVFS